MTSQAKQGAGVALAQALIEAHAMLEQINREAPVHGVYQASRDIQHGSASILRSSNGALILQLNAVVHEPEPEKENQSA